MPYRISVDWYEEFTRYDSGRHKWPVPWELKPKIFRMCVREGIWKGDVFESESREGLAGLVARLKYFTSDDVDEIFSTHNEMEYDVLGQDAFSTLADLGGGRVRQSYMFNVKEMEEFKREVRTRVGK